MYSLKIGNLLIQATSLDDAKKKHRSWISSHEDRTGRGASLLSKAQLNAAVWEDDKLIGHFSYNSRFWSLTEPL